MSSHPDFESTVEALIKSSHRLGDRISWERLAHIRNLVAHGEYRIAIENLCENLYECEGSFDESWIADLEEIALRLELEEYYLNLIRSLSKR
jgi:hypothetical protein